ncbi:Copia protein, partial [Ooceraea biroi]
EAAYTATYLVNRSPTKTLRVTPYEKWNERKLDLSNLKLFGSVAYAKNLGQLRKLDDRSKKYIFVGYAPNGYRL